MISKYASMMEVVDIADLKSAEVILVGVRVPLLAKDHRRWNAQSAASPTRKQRTKLVDGYITAPAPVNCTDAQGHESNQVLEKAKHLDVNKHMSELPGLDLEDFLEWWYGHTTPELVAHWECVREDIEFQLRAFRPE